MARKSSVAASVFFISVLTARRGRTGSIDPSALRDQLEEQVADGDRDAEDIAVFHGPGSTFGGARWSTPTYLGISAFTASHADGQREFGALLVVALPLDRVFHAGKVLPAAARPADLPGGASPDLERGAFLPGPSLSRVIAPSALAEGAAERGDRVVAGPLVLTTDMARNCVRAAWRAVGVGDDAGIDSMASRARASAMLPELRLRVMRTIDESGRVTLSDTDPFRYTEAGAATNWLEARVTFRLDRLLFADEEVALERVRVDRSEVRARIAAKVVQALFEWQRAYALVADTTLPSADHFAAELRELEASAILDVMTDGWFGRYRVTLGARSR